MKHYGWSDWFKHEMTRFFYSFMHHWYSEKFHKTYKKDKEMGREYFRISISYHTKRSNVGMIRTD
jgi:hypothetical protein